MKKLIITDMDGTILDKGVLSQDSRNTIKQIQEAGHYFTLATGRHFLAVRRLSKELNINIPVICGNGAHMINLTNHEVIREVTIPESDVAKIHEVCKNNNIKYVLYCTSYIAGTEDILESLMGELRESLSTKVLSKDELRQELSKVIKVLIIEKDYTLRNKVKEEINQLGSISVVSSNDFFIDCSVKGSNKGVALKELADYLDIQLEDVIAFGDQENDLQMLQTAGTGVAMGNASPIIKEHIKIQTDTVSNEGFSKYIKENLL